LAEEITPIKNFTTTTKINPFFMLKVKREQQILINSLINIFTLLDPEWISNRETQAWGQPYRSWNQRSGEMKAYDIKYMFFSKICPISSSPFQIDMGQTIWKRMLPQRAGCLKP
jgi:hypothetical protein